MKSNILTRNKLIIYFQDNLLLSSTSVNCSSGNPPSFQVPNPWPECIYALDCPTPTSHPNMTHDWTESKGMTFGLNIM